MMTAYLACLGFGGVLTVASLVTGSGDGASDAQADAASLSSEGGDGAHVHHGGSHLSVGVLPFLSLRFWIFSITFFGLTGTGLTGLGAGGAAIVGGIASFFGLGAGYTASRVLQSLARTPVGLLGDASTHVGREGTLLLPLSREQRTKVRLSIGGITTDLVAETESEEKLPAGANVLVVAIRGTVALVEPVPGRSSLSGGTNVSALPPKNPSQ